MCQSVNPTAADESGTGDITFGYRNSPGVTATAHTFVNPVGSDPPSTTDSVGVGPISDRPSSDSFIEVREVPEADDFSFAGVDIPNPCLRRRFGGNFCTHPTAKNVANEVRNPQPPEAQGPSPEEIAASAIDRAVSLAPSPQLEVAPSRVGLTGLDSFFWLASPLRPVTATASVPGLTVIARAVPVQYAWNFGDGTDHVSADSGRPWTRNQDGSISHLYETVGTYRLGVTVIWEAAYSINGGSWQSIGQFSTSDSRPYRVQQMVPALVSST